MARAGTGVVLRAAAWLVSACVLYPLWAHTGALAYAIDCWPSNAEADAWKIARLLTYAAMVPTVALPLGASLVNGRFPQLAKLLALSAIILVPAVFIMLNIWIPAWPR
jgi:hypothetical protein